jgi:serine/threonine protein kinase
MMYYHGKTLESVLAEVRSNNSRLSVGDGFRLLGPLIEAVAALHSAGIYHRDIKPANILIEHHSGLPIIMDLGVVSEFLLAEQTQTTNFLGTIRYSDPSYLRGNQFTAASDWYSLGLVGYELFFATRFLGSEEQWARLVARKLSRKLPSKDDLLKKYQQHNELHGQDATEAVFHTLATLLTKATSQRIYGLREAIASAFWTKPFFERIGGEIVLGSLRPCPPSNSTLPIPLCTLTVRKHLLKRV